MESGERALPGNRLWKKYAYAAAEKVSGWGAGRIGKALSKEEQDTLNIIQHILSKRESKYDLEVLKKLLKWGQERGYFTTLRSIFHTFKWEGLGIELWDAVSDGSKETKGLSTVWKVRTMVLMQLKAEKTAVAGAVATLEPDDPVVAFPTFAQEFFLGKEPVIPSLPSTPQSQSYSQFNRQLQTVTMQSKSLHRLRTPHQNQRKWRWTCCFSRWHRDYLQGAPWFPLKS